jgi:NAD(P)-dependent dehydrogenase (short-subunit alcohol dehydrogenase family)
MSKYAIPEMLKRGSGAIVNVSSVQGLASQRNVVAYATSEHAMIGLTRSMAVDLASRHIRVSCVCPGTVDTPMIQSIVALDSHPQRLRATLDGMHPLGKMAQPSEIGEVVAFSSRRSGQLHDRFRRHCGRRPFDPLLVHRNKVRLASSQHCFLFSDAIHSVSRIRCELTS